MPDDALLASPSGIEAHPTYHRMLWLYEGAARALCHLQGIDPDDPISDAGHVVWQLVGYEAACAELPKGPGEEGDGA